MDSQSRRCRYLRGFYRGSNRYVGSTYSAYLLVKTLGCQISVNSDVMDTNRNIVRTNDTLYTNLSFKFLIISFIRCLITTKK